MRALHLAKVFAAENSDKARELFNVFPVRRAGVFVGDVRKPFFFGRHVLKALKLRRRKEPLVLDGQSRFCGARNSTFISHHIHALYSGSNRVTPAKPSKSLSKDATGFPNALASAAIQASPKEILRAWNSARASKSQVGAVVLRPGFLRNLYTSRVMSSLSTLYTLRRVWTASTTVMKGTSSSTSPFPACLISRFAAAAISSSSSTRNRRRMFVSTR